MGGIMSRTEGSGWGGGVMLYQKCEPCGRKKALYQPFRDILPFHCTWCKERFRSNTLLRITYASQLSEPQKALIQLDKLSGKVDKMESELDQITGKNEQNT